MSRAAELLAQRIERRGPAYSNAANAVRSGFRNLWIENAIEAIEVALTIDPHAEDDE